MKKIGTILGALAWAFCAGAFGIGTVAVLRTDAAPTREVRGRLASVKAEKFVPIVEDYQLVKVGERKVFRKTYGGRSVSQVRRIPHPDPQAHAYWMSLRVSGDATLYATAEEWGGCPTCDRFIKEVAPETEVRLIVSDEPHAHQPAAWLIRGYSAGGTSYRSFVRADIIRPYALAVLGGLTVVFGLLFAGRIRALLRPNRPA